jgi:hypothetical protein
MWVRTGAECAEGFRAKQDSRTADQMENTEIVLGGLCANGKYAFPYPGRYGTTAPVVALRRDQAEHLAIELLKKLNGGELPTDSAELVDFISSLGR